MLRRSVGLVLTGALSVSAFLLPPDFAAVDIGAATEQQRFEVAIPCPECAFQKEGLDGVDDGDKVMTITGRHYDLRLNVSISKDLSQLLVGDVPVWPSYSFESIIVHQAPHGIPRSELDPSEIVSLQVTDFDVSSIAMALNAPPHSKNVETVKFTINGLDRQRVHGGSIQLDLIHFDEGLVLDGVSALVHDDIASTFPDHGLDFFRPKKCGKLPEALCRLMSAVEAQFQSLRHGKAGHRRPCPGAHGRPHPRPGHEDKFGPPRHHGRPRPHHRRPHGHHHHDHRQSFFGAFFQGFVAVLVPIVAGVAVGMIASLFGLLISHVIGLLFHRRNDKYESVTQEEEYFESCDKDMVAEMEAPPVYEDAPAYEQLERTTKT